MFLEYLPDVYHITQNLKNYFTLVLILIFGLITQKIHAQNLVPNPSFEDTLMCPIGLHQVTQACAHWFDPVGNSTSDYFNACHPFSLGWPVSVPYNFMGYQPARTGNAYCGVSLGLPSSVYPYFYAEYISVELESQMIIGQAYEFKMYLNLGDSSAFYTNSFGVLFTTSVHIIPAPSSGISAIPQLANHSDNFISDTANWMGFHQTFVADSSYQFLTIGSFQDYSNTPLISTGSSDGDYVYLFIDDVSLKPVEAVFDTICLGENLSLISQGNSPFSWANSLESDVILSTDSIFVVSPSINTTYYDFSNNDTVNHVVVVTTDGILNLGNDTNLCPGDTLIVDATNSYATYLWQDSTTEYQYAITQEGTYWVEVTNACGVFMDTIHITYNNIPVNLGNDTSLCYGEQLVLNPGLQGVSYLWQNNSTNSSFHVSWSQTPELFYVEVRNATSCGRDTIYIDSPPDFENGFLGNYAVFCEGQPREFSYYSPAADSYLWSDGSTDSSIVINSPGPHWLQLSNKCFTKTDTIIIIAKPTPYFELGDDLVLCNNEKVVIEINSIPDALVWWDTPLTSSPITIAEEGAYIAIASHRGCFYKDTLNIAYEDCDIYLTIPNVFTPNADGMNDFFMIKGENVNFISIKISNRWGQLVFDSNDMNEMWNGKTLDGIDCTSGTYFYIIEAKNKQRSKIFKGPITLLK